MGTFRTPAVAHFGRHACCFFSSTRVLLHRGTLIVSMATLSFFSAYVLLSPACVLLHRGTSIASSAVLSILSSVMLWWLPALTRVFLHRGAPLLQPFCDCLLRGRRKSH